MGQPAKDVDLMVLYRDLATQLRELLRKVSTSGSDRDESQAAAWNAYDAAVRAAHATIEKLVALPAVGDTAAAILNNYLRVAQIGNSAIGSLFAPLWPLVGLTPLTETQALFDRVESLRREVRQMAAPRATRSTEPVVPPRISSSRARRANHSNRQANKQTPVGN